MRLCIKLLENKNNKLIFDQGKSLSLICASLTWLRDFQKEALEQKVLDEGEIPQVASLDLVERL